MNMLHRTCLTQFRRYTETVVTPHLKLLAEPLTNRTLIRVQGAEVVPFLQGLITNDMKHLQSDMSSSMFTMFLNNAGRVLYDAIIYRTPNADTFLIECDVEGSEQLRKHLRLYRVKKKIDIDSVDSELAPWVVYNPIEGGQLPKSNEAEMKIKSSEILISADPRVKELGVRIIQPRSNEVQDIAKLFSNAALEHPSSSSYSVHRYMYGVGEGLKDHPPGKCFPLEANCDFLHGVSFHKGCYIGQELTARVHHTGVVRKRLMPLKLSADPKDGITAVQTRAGAAVGTLRDASQKRALALLRVEQVLKAPELMIDGDPCKVFKPYWWPSELPNRLQMRKD